MDDLLDYQEQPRTTEEINNPELNNLDKIIDQVCDNTTGPFCKLLKNHRSYVDIKAEHLLGEEYTDTYTIITYPPYLKLSIQPKKDTLMSVSYTHLTLPTILRV